MKFRYKAVEHKDSLKAPVNRNTIRFMPCVRPPCLRQLINAVLAGEDGLQEKEESQQPTYVI